jgi:hypothetical protein
MKARSLDVMKLLVMKMVDKLQLDVSLMMGLVKVSH